MIDGARNQVAAEVMKILKGALMEQAKPEVGPPAGIASMLTQDSLDDPPLKIGDAIKAGGEVLRVLPLKVGWLFLEGFRNTIPRLRRGGDGMGFLHGMT